MVLLINICLSVWVFIVFALVIDKIIEKAYGDLSDWIYTLLGGIVIFNVVLTFGLLEYWVWAF